MSDQDSFLNLEDYLKTDYHLGLFSKMSQDFSTATAGKTSEQSSIRWGNSGIASLGEFLTLNTLEHHKDAEESTLSEVLETNAPQEYFLTKEQLAVFLERASERKISLPEPFRLALEAQISFLSNTPQSEENIRLDQEQKASEMTEKPTHSTAEEVQTLFVRRLLPSECESLQGFPRDWTLLDTEQ